MSTEAEGYRLSAGEKGEKVTTLQDGRRSILYSGMAWYLHSRGSNREGSRLQLHTFRLPLQTLAPYPQPSVLFLKLKQKLL